MEETYPLYQPASLVAQMVKYLPATQKTWVQSLGWEDPPEKEMATHSNILGWRIPWTCIVHGIAESDTTERPHLHFLYPKLCSLSCPIAVPLKIEESQRKEEIENEQNPAGVSWLQKSLCIPCFSFAEKDSSFLVLP